MKPRLHFVAGLPRAGSTLLLNLLAQNPRFSVTGTSGLVDVLLGLRGTWDRMDEMRAMPGPACEAAKVRVMRAAIHAFHAPDEYTSVILDKSRSWLAYVEMAELLLCRQAKVLVPVRDVRDVLASLETLWRRTMPTRQIPHEARNYLAFQSLRGRLACWAAPDGMLGVAHARLLDAFARGLGDRLFLVRYEELTRDPAAVLRGVYDFLAEPPFRHDFLRVEAAAAEDDRAYGLPGLHEGRGPVSPSRSRWPEVLGAAAEPYACWNVPLGYPADAGGHPVST